MLTMTNGFQVKLNMFLVPKINLSIMGLLYIKFYIIVKNFNSVPYIVGYKSHFFYLKIGSKIDCDLYTSNTKRKTIFLCSLLLPMIFIRAHVN